MNIKYKVLFHFLVCDVVQVASSRLFDTLDSAVFESRCLLRSESVVKVEIVKEIVNA